MNIAFIFYMTILVFLRFDSIARVLTLVIPLFAIYMLSPSSKILRLHKKRNLNGLQWELKEMPSIKPSSCISDNVTTITVFFFVMTM